MKRGVTFQTAVDVLPGLDATHRIVEIVPKEAPGFSCVLPIPRGWERVDMVHGLDRPGGLRVLGVFAPTSGSHGGRITVSASQPAFEVDGGEWIRYARARSGHRVVVARSVEHPYGPRFEVGCVRSSAGGVEVSRTTGLVDDGRLFEVEVVVPRAHWPGLHDLLWPCGMLLEPRDFAGSVRIETWQRHEGSPLSFSMPGSWEATELPHASPRAVRWVAGIKGGDKPNTAVLWIDVAALGAEDAPSVDMRQRRVRQDLRRHGFGVARYLDHLPDDERADVPGWQGLFRADVRDSIDPLELRVAHRFTDAFAIDYVMLTPAARIDAMTWMRATRALEIAIATTEMPDAP